MEKFCCINLKCTDIKLIESCLNCVQTKNDIAEEMAFTGFLNNLTQMINKVSAYICVFKNCEYSLLLLNDTYMSAHCAQELSCKIQNTVIYTSFTEYENVIYIFEKGMTLLEYIKNDFEKTSQSFYYNEQCIWNEKQKQVFEKIKQWDINLDLIIELENVFGATFTTNFSQMNNKKIIIEWINICDKIYYYEKGDALTEIK